MASLGKWRFIRFLPFILVLPFIFSVFQLSRLQNSKPKADSSMRVGRKKFDHIVLGPAAGQGLPNRIQCQGLKAVKRRHLPSFHLSLVKEKISFVTVFTIYNQSLQNSFDQKVPTNVTVGNSTYDKTGRSIAILNVFANFIKDFLEARLSGHIGKQNQTDHFIFTDSDIAVVDDLSDIVENYPDFHIGLTFRNNKDQPLNSGFILVRGTDEAISKAKAFLEDVLEVYKSMFMKAARMLGDQLALAWIVKNQPLFDAQRFRNPKAFVAEVHRAQVLFLPCAIYNWTPPEGSGQFHGMPEDVKVIHFKGSRKRLMLEAWNFFNSHPIDFSDMMCLILKSGRVKYDF